MFQGTPASSANSHQGSFSLVQKANGIGQASWRHSTCTKRCSTFETLRKDSLYMVVHSCNCDGRRCSQDVTEVRCYLRVVVLTRVRMEILWA